MASLNFKGKSAVWNHHLSVPFHTLDEDKKLSLKGDNANDNLIIEGDNLLVLKALLPRYQGKVKCIYIDPPYNTGNEGWVYNDKMNTPQIKDWYHKTVGKEGEDLTRHDKWLCMMTPRLKLLKELLSDDGVIFISIDDNEIANLKLIMNEIFLEENWLATFVWKSKGSGAYDTSLIKNEHEYILCYSKRLENCNFQKIPTDTTEDKQYIHTDNLSKIGGKYKRQAMAMGTLTYSTSLDFPMTTPDGTEVWPGGMQGGNYIWRWSKPKLEKALKNGMAEWVNTRNGWSLYSKQYEKLDSEGKKIERSFQITSVITDVLNRNGTQELQTLFDSKVFDYPKPINLIKKLLYVTTKNDDIILDSFAGSGTTAHATLQLNKEDSSKRKFILVEMENYANSTTAERIRRVIQRDGYKSGFTYYKLGPALDAETMLAGELPIYENFAKYVYYLATGNDHPNAKVINPKTYFVGKTEQESIYLLYEQDMDKLKSLAVTLKWAQDTHAKDQSKKVVYAPACYLDEESLEQFNIQFVSIPYNLFERNDL